VLEAFSGAAVGVLTIVLARVIRGQHWLYSLGLLTLPTLYAFFALRASEPTVAVKEMIYGIPFVAVGLPPSSMPCTANTFLARSMPTGTE
jgi:hypothetical protein